MDKPPIADVLTHYGGTIPHRHGWAKMKCPFHDDRQASATVNTDENLFRCFACGIESPWGERKSSVDSFDLIGWKEGITDFSSARQFAEELFGGSYGGVLPESAGKRGRRVFGESRPKRGQRNAFQARVRRRTFGGA